MRRHEERHAARKDESQGKSLQSAHGDEEGDGRGKRRDEGDDGHGGRANAVDATSAEDVRQAAERQEEGDSAEEESGCKPGKFRRRAVEFRGDRRNGDVDAAAEKRSHEGREQDCRENSPLRRHGAASFIR